MPLAGFEKVPTCYWYGAKAAGYGDIEPGPFGELIAQKLEEKILELGADAVASFSAEPELDVEVVWPQLSFGHGGLSGGCKVPAGRPERPTRSTGPSAGRWHLPRWRTPAGRVATVFVAGKCPVTCV